MNIYKKLNNMIFEMKKEVVDAGKKSGIYWNEHQWITSIVSDNFQSEEDARKDLLNKLSQYKSVRVVDGDKGVKIIEVDGGYKIYRYAIHAHHAAEIIGYEDRISIFTHEKYQSSITKPIVYASLRFVDDYKKDNNDYDYTNCKDYSEYKKLQDNHLDEILKKAGWEWDEVRQDYYNEKLGVYHLEYLRNSGEKI